MGTKFYPLFGFSLILLKMAIDEEDSNEWKYQGDQYVKSQQYEEAIQCYLYAVHLDPENRSAWNNLGFTYAKLGRLDEAKKVREKVTEIDKNIESNQLAIVKERQKSERKQAIKIYGKYSIIVIIVACVFLSVIILTPALLSSKSPSTVSGPLSAVDPTPIQPSTSDTTPTTPNILPTTRTQTPRNVQILQDILTNYHNTHTYYGPDIYVCGDMASDVWNMVETQGINAILRIGNVDTKVSSFNKANHVWVLAEISKGDWIALETTGGYLVCDDRNICPVSNQLYYSGWDFNNPRELKDALENPCPEGYVLGSDNLCHQACGGPHYCTGDSICINGECKSCEAGYVFGDDLQCHKECPIGSGRYCTGDSICINGECRSCGAGYVFGDDLQCHKECPIGSGRYCPENSVCKNGVCIKTIISTTIPTVQQTTPSYFTITTMTDQNGLIMPGGKISVSLGSSKSFTIVPMPGFKTDRVIVDGVDKGPVTMYTFDDINSNHFINAYFIQENQ